MFFDVMYDVNSNEKDLYGELFCLITFFEEVICGLIQNFTDSVSQLWPSLGQAEDDVKETAP